jgi:hypothetical protein
MCLLKAAGLFFGCSPGCTRYQYLTAIVQVAIHFVSVVEHVNFAGCLAGAKGRHCSMVVCAACALAALGVPPFWIWHDAIQL